MDYAKTFGWIFMIAGVLIIGWTLMLSYNIYTAKAEAPEFFEMPKEEAVLEKGGQDIQAQLQQMLGEQLKGILPAELITQLLNLAVFSMLAFILIFGGTQISSLGIKLIKK